MLLMSVETTYLGLTNIDLVFWSMIGTWIASFGTVAAVIVSLYLAKSSSKIILKIKDSFVFLFLENQPYDNDNYFLSIDVVNQSDKLVTIQQIAIKLHNKEVITAPKPELSTRLPAQIGYGGEVKLMIRRSDLLSWFPSFNKAGFKKSDINKWKISVSTSTSQIFEKKLDTKVAQFFKDHLNE